MSNRFDDFRKDYHESSFWEKLKNYALTAGKEVVEKVLTLYYCLTDQDTPASAKAIIIGALGYFISPVDAIPDLVPIAGYSDDLSALLVAFAMVAVHIKQDHKEKAKEKLEIWFG